MENQTMIRISGGVNSYGLARIAFTLAEVLITLGIIGIVAAMTIPSLKTKIRKTQIQTGVKAAYSIFSQATKLSMKENDSISGWDTDNENEFADKYIVPYLTGVTKLKTHPKMSTLYDADDNNSLLFWAPPFYQLQNGMIFSTHNSNGPINMLLMVDINGQKGPNTLGIDGFVFYFDKEKEALLPSGTNCTKDEITAGKGCGYYGMCSRGAGWRYYQGMHCAALLQKNNWVIPKDYPLK